VRSTFLQESFPQKRVFLHPAEKKYLSKDPALGQNKIGGGAPRHSVKDTEER